MGSSPSPTSNILPGNIQILRAHIGGIMSCFMFLMSVPHLRCAFSLPDDPDAPMLKYSTPSPILKDYN